MPALRYLLPALLALPYLMLSQTPDGEAGIPVTDQLVIAKCGSCHTVDSHGNMQKISWERATPEGWESVLKRMILVNGVKVTPVEARSIVKYLTSSHGLAPEEAKPVMYNAERRIHDESSIPADLLRGSCAKCHAFGRALSWRRSSDDWKEFATAHMAKYKIPVDQDALAYLQKTAPLHTPEWAAWSARSTSTNLTGHWLVSAYVLGRGKFYGEMKVDAGASADDFMTQVKLRSIQDDSTVVRFGHSLLFGGYAWRGRSKGSGPGNATPDDLSNEAHEAMWVAPDQLTAEGRWFWGQYQEFGFDVKLTKATDKPTLIGLDRSSLKVGSKATRIRLIGDKLPAKVNASDLNLGAGVSVSRILSQSPSEIMAEVDVTSDASPGKRDVSLGGSVLSGAIAIYDQVDYVQVRPESALAAFGGDQYPKGYQQFEAIGYQRGPDGKPHTADDLALGPVDVTWSMEVFYAVEGSSSDIVGKISPTGFFTPASESPKINYDIWVIATAKDLKDKNGKGLVGKSYVVVTIPSYTFNGRKYVRDLDRWVEEGSTR